MMGIAGVVDDSESDTSSNESWFFSFVYFSCSHRFLLLIF
jgi:hypothetical protein